MTRATILGSVILLALSSMSPSVARAQVRSGLDYPYPNRHDYIVAFWFLKSDKAGTFQYRIMDPSIPGDYDREAWGKALAAWNKPNAKGKVPGVLMVTGYTTRATSPLTEREQIMEFIGMQRGRRIEDFEATNLHARPAGRGGPGLDVGESKKVVSVADTVWKQEGTGDHVDIYVDFSRDGTVSSRRHGAGEGREDHREATAVGRFEQSDRFIRINLLKKPYPYNPGTGIWTCILSDDQTSMTVTREDSTIIRLIRQAR